VNCAKALIWHQHRMGINSKRTRRHELLRQSGEIGAKFQVHMGNLYIPVWRYVACEWNFEVYATECNSHGLFLYCCSLVLEHYSWSTLNCDYCNCSSYDSDCQFVFVAVWTGVARWSGVLICHPWTDNGWERNE
jgi:hypothetical protein